MIIVHMFLKITLEDIIMKKLLSVLLVAALLAVMAIVPVSAASSFSISVGSDLASVTAGDRIDIIVTVNGVTAGKNLAAVEFDLTYNSDYLEPIYDQGESTDSSRFITTPSDMSWEHLFSFSDGSIYCFVMPKDTGYTGSAVSNSAISNGDTLSFSLPFTVSAAASGRNLTVSVANLVAYDATDMATALTGTATNYSVTVKAPANPVSNIGAKINTNTPALRIGARYDAAYLADISKDEITDVGIIYCDTEALGNNELTATTSGAKKVTATIDSAVEDYTYADYSSFVFYVTFTNIPADEMDKEVSYRAYLSTASETILADNTYVRSYNYVHDILFPSVGSRPGDNVVYPGTGWFE